MKALLFDSETSGLFSFSKRADEPGQPRMASIAAMLVDDKGEKLKSMHRLIKPIDWEPQFIEDAKNGTGAFAVNGLKFDQLMAEGIPVLDALIEFDTLFDECEGFSAYGIQFDSKILRAEQRRAGRPDRYGERPEFCVMKAATDICKIPPTDKMMAAGKKWPKTPKLAEAVKIMLNRDLPGAHNAEVDLEATREIFAIMLGMPGVVTWTTQKPKLQEEAASS